MSSLVNGVNGANVVEYSVPREAERLFRHGLLENKTVSQYLPAEITAAAQTISFTGTDKPSLPIPWRVGENLAALHALEAAMINVILMKKYHVDPVKVEINTDHTLLFPMSLFLWTLDPDGDNIAATGNEVSISKYVVSADRFRRASTPHRAASSSIYRCADGRWFKSHGSLNPSKILDVLELPHDSAAANREAAQVMYREKFAQLTSADISHQIVDAGLCGDTCLSLAEYRQTEQGRANAHVGLFEIFPAPSPTQQPVWWPSDGTTSVARPLAGLKIVDISRIIAGPAVTRGLAELGASVMRIIAPHSPDMSSLHVDLNWGKWNSYVDLGTAAGRTALRALIAEADVVVDGYRPGTLDQFGFSQADILELVRDRDRGIITVRENCYGWYGPWRHRPGWQPVSDAFVGISHAYGAALGLRDGEPVTPIFPTTDYATGLAGIIAILSALTQRAKHGGSYRVEIALNYSNQFLAGVCGAYPDQVWKGMLERYGPLEFRAEHPMEYTASRTLKLLREHGRLRDEFFEQRHSGALGVDVRCVKPAIRFPGGEVQLRYNVGCRGNGTDAAKWPSDLGTEVVS